MFNNLIKRRIKCLNYQNYKVISSLNSNLDLKKNIIEQNNCMNEHMLKEFKLKGYIVIDNFLNDEMITTLSDEIVRLMIESSMIPACIGRDSNKSQISSIRGDLIYWIEPIEKKNNLAIVDIAKNIYFNKLNEIKNMFNERFYLGINSIEAHFVNFPINSFYKKHIDKFGKSNNKPQRLISSILYLNDSTWCVNDGGQLRLYLNNNINNNSNDSNNNYIDILPIRGRAILFLSDQFFHQVLPSTTRNRKSIAAWMLSR